jgi:hypothetical protein
VPWLALRSATRASGNFSSAGKHRSRHEEGEREWCREGIDLTGATCGAEICRVEIRIDDEIAGLELAANLPYLLPTQGRTRTFVDLQDPSRLLVFSQREAEAPIEDR